VSGELVPVEETRNRTVYLTPKAGEALERVPRLNTFVWHTKRGSQMSQRVQHQYWTPVREAFWGLLPAARRAEVPADFDFAELRHFFGSALAGLGVAPWAIAEQMGDADGGKRARQVYWGARADALDEVEKAFWRAQAVGQ
jgi:integrase